MKNKEKSVKNIWENYLSSIGECSNSSNKFYDSWHFCDAVDKRLANIEEDKSLSYWIEAHKDFFKRELEALNMEFREAMVVVFEEFEVLYK
ncbi:ASCH domain-containing protein [Paraclostridium bifermentans]|uniref:ASCH domain-containing protein n=1 Tax=Paraclostridium bifermentans TaxID=1490 RepID=UPI00290BC780|nr:ASCH domain-containing protein [Paraclostridium bifermentans]MDU3337541.1 ASCH domain-containing protein [Paraclostridium bifermentans]